MITLGGYHEYTGDIMSTLGSLSTPGAPGAPGGYHEYTRGYHDKHGTMSLGKQLNLFGNPSVLNIPHCTHDISPHSSWYPSGVIMISPTRIMVSPVYSWYCPVYWTPQCTRGVPRCTDCTDIMQGREAISRQRYLADWLKIETIAK